VLLALTVFLLIAASTGSLLFAALYPRVAAGSALDQRLELISDSNPLARRPGNNDDGRRHRSVEEILREVDEKQKAAGKTRSKPSLLLRLRQANLSWSKTTYWLVRLAVGIVVLAATSLALGLGILPAIGFAITGGLAGPHLYVSYRRKARFAKFTEEFPNAVEIVVRGVKTGLPLIDCLKIIADESQEPVRGEFKKIVEDQVLGMSLAEAIERLPERIPLPEAIFFSIVVAIQSRTGGALSEALGNLARVLRDRKKMQAKIKAMSSEAKASAGIIGSLPVFVAGAVYLTSPKYIELLFITSTGHMVLYGCGIWMTIGVLVMRKMINFQF